MGSHTAHGHDSKNRALLKQQSKQANKQPGEEARELREVRADCPVRGEPGIAALDGRAQREGATVGTASQETMNHSVSRVKVRKNGAEGES